MGCAQKLTGIKIVKFILPTICLTAIGYGYWGAFTLSGQKVYDEMDAMTPFFVMVGASIVLFIWLIYKLYLFLRKPVEQ